jgi:hypothetical protein
MCTDARDVVIEGFTETVGATTFDYQSNYKRSMEAQQLWREMFRAHKEKIMNNKQDLLLLVIPEP